MYAWVITKDLLDGCEEGIRGPRGCTLTSDEIKATGTPFRMKNDDGEVCYEGVCVHEGDEEGAFGPLDDFGMPNAGCTTIEYKEFGKWVVT